MIVSNSLLVLASVAFLGYSWFMLRDSLRRDTEVLAEAMGSNCTAALSFDDGRSAQEILSSLSANPVVMEGTIYRPDGSLLAAYRKGGRRAGAAPRGRRRNSARNSNLPRSWCTAPFT